MSVYPLKEQFIAAIQNAPFTDRERTTLTTIASSPNYKISPSELMSALGANAEVTANKAMGNLGKKIATHLNFQVDTEPYGGAPSWFSVISLYEDGKWNLHNQFIDALQEIGMTDNHFPVVEPEGSSLPERKLTSSLRIQRDSRVTKKVKGTYNYQCQIKGCGYSLQLPNGQFYAEGHHIRPIGNHEGSDLTTNVICVCANHHKELDYGTRRLDLSDLVIHSDHKVDQANIDYHNTQIVGHIEPEEP
jgi:predicted HNH restriction endonuclease